MLLKFDCSCALKFPAGGGLGCFRNFRQKTGKPPGKARAALQISEISRQLFLYQIGTRRAFSISRIPDLQEFLIYVNYVAIYTELLLCRSSTVGLNVCVVLRRIS